MIEKNSIYSRRRIKIPAPHFVVFYNGIAPQPERQILKLSDLYYIEEESPMLELQVVMLNINQGNNEELKKNCKCLNEYMQFVEKVRSYHENGELQKQEAVELAVTECIKEGILEEFLTRNRAEVVSMSIFEFDEEKEWKKIREDEFQYGVEQGIEQGLVALIFSLKRFCKDPDDIYQTVTANKIYKNISKAQVLELMSVMNANNFD